MNTINTKVINSAVTPGISAKKPQAPPQELTAAGDTFSASEAPVNNPAYSPDDVNKNGNTEVTLSDKIKGGLKGAAAGIGMGLAAGAAMTVVGGTLGTAFFAVGDFLLDIMMVPHNMQVGLDTLVTLAKTAFIMGPSLFGAIGAIGGFMDPLNKGNKEPEMSQTPTPNPA